MAGIVGAFAAVSVLEDQLFGVRAQDAAVVIAATAIVLAAAALCATLFPARRAATVDPVVAIRVDG